MLGPKLSFSEEELEEISGVAKDLESRLDSIEASGREICDAISEQTKKIMSAIEESWLSRYLLETNIEDFPFTPVTPEIIFQYPAEIRRKERIIPGILRRLMPEEEQKLLELYQEATLTDRLVELSRERIELAVQHRTVYSELLALTRVYGKDTVPRENTQLYLADPARDNLVLAELTFTPTSLTAAPREINIRRQSIEDEAIFGLLHPKNKEKDVSAYLAMPASERIYGEQLLQYLCACLSEAYVRNEIERISTMQAVSSMLQQALSAGISTNTGSDDPTDELTREKYLQHKRWN